MSNELREFPKFVIQTGRRNLYRRTYTSSRTLAEPLSQEKVLEELGSAVYQDYLSMQLVEVWQNLSTLTSEITSLKKAVSEASKKINSRNIVINNLRSSAYKLLTPLHIALEMEGDTIIANCYDINQYGSGINEEEAITNLCEIIVEYYECLLEDQDKLGILPMKHWSYMKEIITNRQ